MPSETAKQHRAMEAAAHGKSNIGIPKSVGKEFVAADKHEPHKFKNVKREGGHHLGKRGK